MNFEKYQLRVIRVSRPWFGSKSFYIPTVLALNSEGQSVFQPFLNDEEYPFVWGFDSEYQAWEACVKHYGDPEDEPCPCSHDGGTRGGVCDQCGAEL